jgi:integrase
VGHVRIREFTSANAAYFEKERAKAINRRTKKPIAKATINRGLAVLSHLFTFAIKKRLISAHPMTRYGRLPEKEKAVRIMTLEEERRLVQSVMDESPIIGCFVGLLGETGLRKSECLRLKWEHVDLKTRTLIVEAGKTGETRYVPLSDFAVELLEKLSRFDGCPFVFVWPETKQPVHDPRFHFFNGRIKAGLPHVGFHDLRRYRGTKWMMNGVDSRSTQGLLGHKYLGTTQRYAKYMGHHANQSVIEAQKKEALEVAAFLGNKLATQDGQTEMQTVSS